MCNAGDREYFILLLKFEQCVSCRFSIFSAKIVLGNNGYTACHLEELDLLGFMIDYGPKLSHKQHEPHWQVRSLEHFALISAN